MASALNHTTYKSRGFWLHWNNILDLCSRKPQQGHSVFLFVFFPEILLNQKNKSYVPGIYSKQKKYFSICGLP